MPDVVVTVPRDLWASWLAEGERPGKPEAECGQCGWTGPRDQWRGHLDPDLVVLGQRVPCGAGARDLEWHFYAGGPRPTIAPGDRVYVVAHGLLRGYAPLVRLEVYSAGRFAFVRLDGGVAVTIDEPVRGFQGWRYRWWERAAERPFPEYERWGVQ
jgi:hypothetical protein